MNSERSTEGFYMDLFFDDSESDDDEFLLVSESQDRYTYLHII